MCERENSGRKAGAEGSMQKERERERARVRQREGECVCVRERDRPSGRKAGAEGCAPASAIKSPRTNICVQIEHLLETFSVRERRERDNRKRNSKAPHETIRRDV